MFQTRIKNCPRCHQVGTVLMVLWFVINLTGRVRAETEDDDDEFSHLRIQTESKLEFDLAKGVFVSKKMTGNVRFKLGSDDHTFPVKLSYQMVNLDELFAETKPKMKLDLIADKAVGLTNDQLDRFRYVAVVVGNGVGERIRADKVGFGRVRDPTIVRVGRNCAVSWWPS